MLKLLSREFVFSLFHYFNEINLIIFICMVLCELMYSIA